MSKWNNKIFISRAGADAELAEAFAGALEAADYPCFYQNRDFKIGESFKGNMREVFEDCEIVLAIMSPEYWDSPFCMSEWDAAYVHDLSNTGVIIPVKPRACKDPRLYVDRAYLDLTNKPQEAWSAALVAAVDNVLKHGGTLPDKLPRMAAPITNSAFITKNFTGRDDELASLNQALWEERETVALTPPTAVSGLGGVGKSAIAREYARRHQHRYAGTWLVRSELQSEMLEDLAALAIKLDDTLRGENDIGGLAEKAFELAALEAQKAERPFLFVFDNVEQESDMPEAARAKGFHTIATSRWEAWTDARQVEIKKLPAEAAAILMLSITDRQADAEGFSDLMAALDGLTLAIVQAGAYLRENKLESFADYLAALTHRLGTKAIGAKNSDDDLVSATFMPSIEKAEEDAPGAYGLLMSTAFYAPDDIPLAILTEEPESDETKAAANALLRYSLVTQGSESEAHGASLSLHRILQDVLRAQLEGEAKEGLLKLSAERLIVKVPNDPDDVRDWPQIMPLAPHVSALSGFDKAAVGGDALSRCLNQTAMFYRSRASYAVAEPLYRRALEIFEAVYGPDHPTVATGLNNLALLLKGTNRLDEAEPLYRRCIEIWESSLGADHPNIASGLNNLAGLLLATNRLDEAEPLYRRCIEIWESSLGADHPNVASGLNNLAGLLEATNRLDEAEPLYRRALEIDEANYGPDHPEVATDLNNLAVLLAQTRRASEALPLARRAHEIRAASLPEGHPLRAQIEKELPIFELKARVEAAGLDWDEFLKKAAEKVAEENGAPVENSQITSEPESEIISDPQPKPRAGRGRIWLVLLLLAGVAGVGAWAMRDSLLQLLN